MTDKVLDPKNCGNKGSSSRTKKNLWLAPSKDGGMCRVALLCLLSSTFCCHFVMLKRAPYKHKRREALLICQTSCIELSILWKSPQNTKASALIPTDSLKLVRTIFRFSQISPIFTADKNVTIPISLRKILLLFSI